MTTYTNLTWGHFFLKVPQCGPGPELACELLRLHTNTYISYRIPQNANLN